MKRLIRLIIIIVILIASAITNYTLINFKDGFNEEDIIIFIAGFIIAGFGTVGGYFAVETEVKKNIPASLKQTIHTLFEHVKQSSYVKHIIFLFMHLSILFTFVFIIWHLVKFLM